MSSPRPARVSRVRLRAHSPSRPRKGTLIRRAGSRSGQSVVEFALVVPVFVFLLLIAVDFGRLFFSYVQVTNAAREGAAYAAAAPTDTVGIQSRALQEANVQGQAGEHPLVVSATCANTAGATMACSAAPGGTGKGNTVTVRVVEPFGFFTPLINQFLGNGFQIASSSTVAVLGLAPTGSGNGGTCATLPTASFVVSVSNKTVTLNANASGPTSGDCAISGYNWDMGDGLDPFPPVTGNPASYTYASAGSYLIHLEVTNSAGSATMSQTVVIGSPSPSPSGSANPSPSPSASPSASPTAAPTATPVPTPVCNFVPTFSATFTGTGNGSKAHEMSFQGAYTGQPAPLSWTWTFGDGSTDTGQNPSRRYVTAGTYNVVLTITNGTCTRSTASTPVTVP
jgi:PKD repeat protein